MRELSLFSGAGGGLLGTHLLGWRPIGYVEFDDYCQRVIAARIRDGILPDAPIFGDVRAFNGEGYAGRYRGVADVITAGFPCQPFSTAGKRAGVDDPRNMWPATIECIRLVRPRYCLLENVPGLLSSGYFGTVLGDLAACGYDTRWRVLSAAEVGAPHRRDRLWIVADSTQGREYGEQRDNCCAKRTRNKNEQESHASRKGELADTNEARLPQFARRQLGGVREAQEPTERSIPCGASATGERRDWWQAEPDVGRVADGVASRVDRLKALGNGQVSPVVAAVWRMLTEVE